MTTKELLICARDRIKDPERWTTAEYARAADGGVCLATSSIACRWCADGALVACAVGDRYGYHNARALLNDATPWTVITTNDHKGHTAVMEMYERAIEAAS